MKREEPHPNKIISASEAAYWLDCSVRSVKERIEPDYYEGTRPKFRYQKIIEYRERRAKIFQDQKENNCELLRRAA